MIGQETGGHNASGALEDLNLVSIQERRVHEDLPDEERLLFITLVTLLSGIICESNSWTGRFTWSKITCTVLCRSWLSERHPPGRALLFAALLLAGVHRRASTGQSINLFIFDLSERGVQALDPFFTIWESTTNWECVGTNLAILFILPTTVTCLMFLSYLRRLQHTISTRHSSLPAMFTRRLFYQGVIEV